MRGWGQTYTDANKEAEEAKRKEAEASRARRRKPSAESGEAKVATKRRKRAVPQLPDAGAAFDNAFKSLVNPSASAQERGASRIADMGTKAVPLVEKKLAESTDDANARKMLARALAKLRRSEASGLLITLVADVDQDVQKEALKSLSVHGPVAQDALAASLASDDPAIRAAAARTARRLPFPEHTGIILSLLADADPKVRMHAAGALSARPDTPETHAALVEATGDAVLDVATAAAETLIKQKGALQDVLRALAGMGTSSQSLQSPRTVFLAMPLLTWRDPGGMETLSTHLGAGKSGAEVFDYVRRFLDPKNPISRVDALKEARFKGLEEPQMVLAAGLCLADANDFVARSALRYVSSLDELDHPIPLVIMLGHKDIRFAVNVARELAKRPNQATTDALKLAADGVTLQRKVMATGLLARRGDAYGSEFLREVAMNRPGLPPPLAGWAAYHYSFLGSADDVPGFVERAKSSRSDRDRASSAAAAAKLGDAGALAGLRNRLGPASKGFHARLVVRLLGELQDTDARDKLVYQLHQNDPELLEAVIESLRLLGDSSVVRSVIERIPQVRPDTAEVLCDAVRSFGAEAEPHLLDLVDDDNPRVRGAAMDWDGDGGTLRFKRVPRALGHRGVEGGRGQVRGSAPEPERRQGPARARAGGAHSRHRQAGQAGLELARLGEGVQRAPERHLREDGIQADDAEVALDAGPGGLEGVRRQGVAREGARQAEDRDEAQLRPGDRAEVQLPVQGRTRLSQETEGASRPDAQGGGRPPSRPGSRWRTRAPSTPAKRRVWACASPTRTGGGPGTMSSCSRRPRRPGTTPRYASRPRRSTTRCTRRSSRGRYPGQ